MTTAPSAATLDFVVTGTTSPEHAQTVRDAIAAFAERHPDLGRVRVFHWCAPADKISESGVSEIDWLLYNAASAKFIAHVHAPDIGHVRNPTFLDLKKIIADFNPQKHIKVTKKSPGRILITPSKPVPGVRALYYNNHDGERKLRMMSASFRAQPNMAMLVPFTLNGLPDASQVPFLLHLAPSIQKTIGGGGFFHRSIYLGIDDDEVLSDTVTQLLQAKSRVLHRTRNIPLRIVRVPHEFRNDENWSRMYNLLFLHAVMDGADFVAQLQDDTRLETPGWDRMLASFLCTNPLALGAYSLQERWSVKRMDNVMVSRSHFDVFGYMFNPAAPDSSAWLEQVYTDRLAKVVPRTKITNMIRRERRRRNRTDQVYKNYGKTTPMDKEREVCKAALDRCVAVAL